MYVQQRLGDFIRREEKHGKKARVVLEISNKSRQHSQAFGVIRLHVFTDQQSGKQLGAAIANVGAEVNAVSDIKIANESIKAFGRR